MDGLIPGLTCKPLPKCSTSTIDLRNSEIPGVTCIPLPPVLPKCSTGTINIRNSEIPGVTCVESPEEKPELPPCLIESDESVDLRSGDSLIPGKECPFRLISG